MQLGFFISGGAGQMMQNRLDSISNNLANASTVGYMEDRTAFSSMFSSKMGREGIPDNTSAAHLSMNTQYTSIEPGSIRSTGGEFDFAIHGKAFFRVQMQNGTEALTRAGNFQIDAEGNLKTQNGHPVLDNNGSAIQLPRGEVSATKNGTIFVNGDPVTELGLSMLVDPRKIQKSEGVLIHTPKENVAPADNSVSVHHHSLEESNVNSVLTMTEMIATTREYESMMKTLENYNQQASLLNDRVGLVQG
ncbi:flagellar basal-body rod protein FlgF [Mariprofundus micogutta]|uniref:Flagellar basal-body rod protein FlgF n=1 Tax=Mariprofundus micogutta TaxID=1921010 RepID=A0A1L8CKI9_9PROT|nr:flagellar hook-basal body protein [Mariprofundus micogutta]GAV19426.1 flagellar basal-body rod protein FlgF [Mariprofundus micogutta]